MTVSEAIAGAQALTGQTVDGATLARWLSALDGRLARELGRSAPAAPYDATADAQTALLAPWPWDGFYVHHLEAMTYYSAGEYDRYENARVMAERGMADWRAYLRRTGQLTEGGAQ